MTDLVRPCAGRMAAGGERRARLQPVGLMAYGGRTGIGRVQDPLGHCLSHSARGGLPVLAGSRETI